MDEGTGGDVQDCSKRRNDFKKDFIEKWLVNLSFEYKERGNRRKKFDSNLTGSADSGSAGSSRLDFWEEEEAEYRRKKKVSKLQFFNTLKNIFKKKKGEYGSDELSGESTFKILSMGVGQEMLSDVKDNTPKDGLFKNSSGSSNSNSQQDTKRDGGTQTLVAESVVRISAPGASIKNLDTLDQFNRGFSEIIRSKNYYEDNICEEMGGPIERVQGTSEVRRAIGECEQDEPAYRTHPKSVGDGWEVLPSSESSCSSVKVAKAYVLKTSPPASSPFTHVVPLQATMSPVDSYVNKLELIKTYFGTRSARVEPPKPKPSVTMFRPATNRASSRTISVTDSCALTKDLTDAPYLREHERIQWQGRNREIWFRINALYQKYNRQHNELEQQKEKLTAANPQHRTRDVAPALEKIYYHTRGMNNRSDSYLPYSRKRESERLVRNRLLSLGNTETKRHVKLEEIFVTEHIKNHKGVKQLPTSLESCHRRPKHVDHYRYYKKPRVQGWHCALEQVRVNMQRMSDDDVEIVRSSATSRIHQRCRSKISVALSSSDWEDVSTPSLDSSQSHHSMKLHKPLPNIPYTPSFRHHFRARF